MIGLCTAVIGDVAGHLGCFIFLKDSVNAIAFVALGTSVPGRVGKKWQGSEESQSISPKLFCLRPLALHLSMSHRKCYKPKLLKTWPVFYCNFKNCFLHIVNLDENQRKLNCHSLVWLTFISCYLWRDKFGGHVRRKSTMRNIQAFARIWTQERYPGWNPSFLTVMPQNLGNISF